MRDAPEIEAEGAGRLSWPGGAAACVFGRGGLSARKREGDGATPIAVMALRRVLFRPDRRAAPSTRLAVSPLAPDDGWSDDVGDPAYNRFVRLPHPWGHERLWREDRLYDLLVVLGWNDAPARPGLGSAIFLHLTAPDRRPTAGCVAVEPDALEALLAAARPGWRLAVRA